MSGVFVMERGGVYAPEVINLWVQEVEPGEFSLGLQYVFSRSENNFIFVETSVHGRDFNEIVSRGAKFVFKNFGILGKVATVEFLKGHTIELDLNTIFPTPESFFEEERTYKPFESKFLH